MAVVDGKEFMPLKRLLAANFGDRPDLPLLAGCVSSLDQFQRRVTTLTGPPIVLTADIRE